MIREKLPTVQMPPVDCLYGKFVDGELKAVVGVQQLLVIEPLVADAGEANDLIAWVDGMLSGHKAYSFFVDDRYSGLGKIVEMRFREVVKGFTGKMFTRHREVI